jgi:glucose-6-phosphate isomerase
MISIDTSFSKITDKEMGDKGLKSKVLNASKKLTDLNGADNKWLYLPDTVTTEIGRIKTAAAFIRKNCDVLLVLGVGGSYAGALAGISYSKHLQDFPVEFAGFGFTAPQYLNFIEKYKNKRVAVNIISKSGTTMEIIAALNIIDTFMQKKYPKPTDYAAHTFITTGPKGHMRDFATVRGISPFLIPDGVGGRYSVLSAVGLLPLAVAGINIDEILAGANEMRAQTENLESPAYVYAATRFLLHTAHKKSVELIAGFNDTNDLALWQQQLFGESEGKDGRGLLPVAISFSRDLHSLGQFIQQGSPIIFETMLRVAAPAADYEFAAGTHPANTAPVTHINKLNDAAYLGTVKAHAGAGVPIITIIAPDASAKSFGALVYFFEVSCAISAYLLGVNPFDQAGVEFYKKDMKEIINKISPAGANGSRT